MPVDLGENYRNNGSFLERDFLNGLVAALFANPMVKVTGSKLVHVAVNRLGTKTIIHLTNTAGQHAVKEIFSYDEVPHWSFNRTDTNEKASHINATARK